MAREGAGLRGNPNFSAVDILTPGVGGVPPYVVLSHVPPGQPVVQTVPPTIALGGGGGGADDGKGKDKDKGGGGGGGNKRPPFEGPSKKQLETSLKGRLEMVEKVREHLLRELTVFLSKLGDPWYAFAGIYAGLSGGNVVVDDLMGTYPYDFYNSGMWDRRKRSGTGYSGLEESQKDREDAVRAYDDRDARLEAMNEFVRNTVTADDVEEITRDAVNGLVEELRRSTDEMIRQLGEAKPEAGSPAAARYSENVAKSQARLQADFARMFKRTLDSIEKETKEAFQSSLPTSSTTEAREKTLESLKGAFGNLYDLGKESTYLDLDDILYGNPAAGSGQPDPALQNMGICILKPEFKGLIEGCVDSINVGCRPKKNFTAYELISSPMVRTGFAKFMILHSTPLNPKMSSRKPFRREGGGDYYGGNNGGNVTIIQANASTRYNNTKLDSNQEGGYHWFGQVFRNDYGILVHLAPGESLDDDNDGDDDYYYYNNNDNAGSDVGGGKRRREQRGRAGGARRFDSLNLDLSDLYAMPYAPAVGSVYPFYGSSSNRGGRTERDRRASLLEASERLDAERRREEAEKRVRDIKYYGRGWREEYM